MVECRLILRCERDTFLTLLLGVIHVVLITVVEVFDLLLVALVVRLLLEWLLLIFLLRVEIVGVNFPWLPLIVRV